MGEEKNSHDITENDNVDIFQQAVDGHVNKGTV